MAANSIKQIIEGKSYVPIYEGFTSDSGLITGDSSGFMTIEQAAEQAAERDDDLVGFLLMDKGMVSDATNAVAREWLGWMERKGLDPDFLRNAIPECFLNEIEDDAIEYGRDWGKQDDYGVSMDQRI